MLVELAVENYAVIEQARVRFGRGLNLLTGETGSGKSMVVDALGLLLGGRASADMLRSGAQRARVSGIFEVAPAPALTRILDDAGITLEDGLEDGELLVEREVQAGGKSRAFVANRPATAALLRDLAPHLADIHGQHDQQQLFSPAVQCETLDGFAGSGPLAEETAALFRRWRRAQAELEELDRNAREVLRMVDLWEFQRREIEAVAPRPGEDSELENERRVLANVAKLQENAGAAYDLLSESAESVTSQLRAAVKRLEEMARIDEGAGAILETLAPAREAVQETTRALERYLDRLEADPARLDQVESRLAALEKLRRKYGPDVLAFLDTVRGDLASAETSSDRRAALQKESAGLAQEYQSLASKLSVKRKEAAKQLARRVETELGALAMERTKVEIRVEMAEWSESGVDAVSFWIAPNVGEELKPLEKIASGGELSRVALAIKTCSGVGAKKTVPRTLVFDEVDAGVGGSAAEAVGRRLKKLSESSQVICVTHLAQIAGFADHHYFVEKHASQGRTVASVSELTRAERTQEIGRMLSGERVTAEALRHAEQLLKLAAK